MVEIMSTNAKAYFGRRYLLSASHRLHTDQLSMEENRAIYGKCNNPHGRSGHDCLGYLRINSRRTCG